VLWSLGTLTGLASSLAVPYVLFTRLRAAPDSAFGGWLMPLVPPMVSASTGALLVPHLPAGQPRLTMLLACYAMFGLTLIASVVVITLIWHRLVRHTVGAAAMVPTLWIVLGPLGQSITAANLLGGVAPLALPRPYSTAFSAFGVVYGVPVWGFAALWAALATALTVRAARERLPFSLTWWSFTFPVGTVVTGTSGLALHTGSDAFRWAAVGLYVALVTAWAVVSVHTARGAWRGHLFLAAPPPAATDPAAPAPAQAAPPSAALAPAASRADDVPQFIRLGEQRAERLS
jgi:tellurite resistance protein TehA-like permease